jgi:hypothetical protein
MFIESGKVLGENRKERDQGLHHFRVRRFERRDRPKHRSEATNNSGVLFAGKECIRCGGHIASLLCEA